MQDDRLNTHFAPDTQRNRAWSAAEIEKIREIAARPVRKEELCKLFPGRTLATVKVRLYHVRRELNLPTRRCAKNPSHDIAGPPMLDPNDPGLADNWNSRWSRKAVASNQLFLQALSRAA